MVRLLTNWLTEEKQMKNTKYNSAEIKKYMADHKVSRSTAIRHLYPAKAAAAPAKLRDDKKLKELSGQLKEIHALQE
jgi:hypothetical protein